MADDRLTFDAEKHEYRWNGVVVPSVTQVLAPLVDYTIIPKATLEIARQKGMATHKMVELDCKGDLDEDTLPEWMLPVLAQWRRFVADTGFEMHGSEERVYNANFGYAGTYDLRGTIRTKNGLGIVDIKRSFLAGEVIGYQTAAYANASDKIQWRAALRLHENKQYLFQFYDDRGDFSNFLVCLAFFKLKKKL